MPYVLAANIGPVAVITLNRPERLNAWTTELGDEYFDALDAAAIDPAIRAIVVTGAGRGFCAGADMDMLAGAGSQGGELPKARRPHTPQSHTTTIPKPVIGAINGACAGLGLVQALMFDIRFAAAGAKFTTAFVRRGLIAEHGISWVLPRLIGPARSLDILMSGRTFLAEEAKELGLVNDVLPAGEVVDHAVAYATELATWSSPAAMAAMKRQIWDHALLPMADATAEADKLMRASLKASDFREGVSSFLEKRTPVFSTELPSWAVDGKA